MFLSLSPHTLTVLLFIAISMTLMTTSAWAQTPGERQTVQVFSDRNAKQDICSTNSPSNLKFMLVSCSSFAFALKFVNGTSSSSPSTKHALGLYIEPEAVKRFETSEKCKYRVVDQSSVETIEIMLDDNRGDRVCNLIDDRVYDYHGEFYMGSRVKLVSDYEVRKSPYDILVSTTGSFVMNNRNCLRRKGALVRDRIVNCVEIQRTFIKS